MATKILATNYANGNNNLLYDPTNGNVEITEAGLGGRILFTNGTFTTDGKNIYNSTQQNEILGTVKNDVRSASTTVNGKLQSWAQDPKTAQAAPPDGAQQTPAAGESTVGGLTQFEKGTFGKDNFGSLMYPITMNGSQDRIFITQLQYTRTDVLQQESDFAKLDSVGYVTLPMPNDITEANQTGWGDDSLSNIAALAMPNLVSAGIAGAEGDIAKSVSDAFQSVRNVLMSGGAKTRVTQFLATKAAASVVQKFGVNVNPEAYISRATGAAINPNLELLFSGPKLRQFGFQFKMTPRSQEEAVQIRKIIRFFKKGMAPRRSATNPNASFFLGTPNVFKIKFLSGNTELKSIGKFKTCALVSFTANYTPDGFYAAYNDSKANGSQPISVTMQMAFNELTPVFSDEYGDTGDGYSEDDVGPNKFDYTTPTNVDEASALLEQATGVAAPTNEQLNQSIPQIVPRR